MSGVLDCLRNSIDVSGKYTQEPADAYEKRIAAEWNSACAFDAHDANGQTTWLADAKEKFGLT